LEIKRLEKMKKKQILQKIKETILNVEPDAKIFLYGSRARKTQKRNSDWDILILLNYSSLNTEIERKIAYPLYNIEFETGQIISPMIYSENEWNTKYQITPFYENVMKEKIEL
jgi:predicted nucleotidyltransferase